MEPVVATTAGRVRGRADDGALAFLGVPFAAPPVGVHRLAAPARPEPWDGVRDALVYGPTAQQPEDEIVGGIPEPSIPGDDILTVNVFTPDLGATGLPVLVWFHGGGFTAGSPASPWYRGTRFARDGVIVVTVGYRLGAEGFLLLDGAPPNRAILDWLFALEWVHENIAAFGGDPGLVTVAGQSAGAVACTTLLSLPRAEGLFRRVVSMSGVAYAMATDQAQSLALTMTGPLGVEPTRAAVAALPPSALHDSQLALQRAQAEAGLPTDGSMPSPLTIGPVVDGELVPDKPLRAIAQGHGRDQDLLAGATRDEVARGIAEQAAMIGEDLLPAALATLGLPADAYRELHRDLTPPEVVGRAATDRIFRSRVHDLAEARVAGSSGPGRTFAYEFRWQPPAAHPGHGAVHCIDIPFAFDNLDAPDVMAIAGPEPPQPLADLVHGSWVRFVATGDPGWPVHDLADRQMMLFDVESGPASDPLRPERLLWATR